MKNILTLSLLLFLSVANAQNLIFKVKNVSKDTEISLRTIHKRTIQNIDVKDGQFKTENLNLEEGYYTLFNGNETVNIYLKPSADLSIDFDTEDMISSITFSGTGAENNNYLITKLRNDTEVRSDSDAFYKVDEKTYLKKLNRIKEQNLALLQSLKVDASFKREAVKDLEYDYLLDVFNYPYLQDFYFGKKVALSTSSKKIVNKIDYDNEEDYNTYPSYKNLASLKWGKDIKKAKGFNQMNAVFRSIKTVPLKIDLLIGFYYSISKEAEKSEDYYKMISAYITDKTFLKEAKKQLDNVKKTRAGNKSPDFEYKTAEGKTIRLSDFLGKYVFIDVWATWCQPCMQQLPHLKKLEKRYHNKNIVFIGISVDSKDQYDTWKTTLKEKHMEGIQVFADNSFESEFIEAYGISSIPRFIIIDPKGQIVDPNAEKPSKEITIKVLDELLK